MTNFEWLIKNNLYGKFVADSHMDELSFRKIYKIEWRYPESNITDDLLRWLNQEHKEPKHYVPLEDVLEILREGKEKFTPTWTKSMKCKFEVPTIDFALWYDDKMNKIKHLEYKTEGKI